jgi:hypothetical protein
MQFLFGAMLHSGRNSLVIWPKKFPRSWQHWQSWVLLNAVKQANHNILELLHRKKSYRTILLRELKVKKNVLELDQTHETQFVKVKLVVVIDIHQAQNMTFPVIIMISIS